MSSPVNASRSIQNPEKAVLRIILKNSALYIVYAGRVNGGCRSDAINGQQLLLVEFCWADKIKKSDFSPHNLGAQRRNEYDT